MVIVLLFRENETFGKGEEPSFKATLRLSCFLPLVLLGGGRGDKSCFDAGAVRGLAREDSKHCLCRTFKINPSATGLETPSLLSSLSLSLSRLSSSFPLSPLCNVSAALWEYRQHLKARRRGWVLWQQLRLLLPRWDVTNTPFTSPAYPTLPHPPTPTSTHMDLPVCTSTQTPSRCPDEQLIMSLARVRSKQRLICQLPSRYLGSWLARRLAENHFVSSVITWLSRHFPTNRSSQRALQPDDH